MFRVLVVWRYLVVIAGFLIAASHPAIAGDGLTKDNLIGTAAPPLALEKLSGGRVSLDDLRGKRVIVHFWATWCGACVKEMPELDHAQRDLAGENLVVLAVNVGEARKKVEQYIGTRGYSFPVALDPDWKVAERYRVVALPASFLVDEHGVVRERVDGGTLTREKVAELVRHMTDLPSGF